MNSESLQSRLSSRGAAGGIGQIGPLTSRRHQIVHLLREAIIRGDLGPGEQLRQEHICEALGVSPTPVREALRQLETEGLVTHFPNRGVFVADVSQEELFQVLLPIRLILEQFALAREPHLLGQQTLEELSRLVDEMDAAARRDDFAAATEADVRFHEVCVLQANVPYVTNMWQAVHSHIRLELHRMGGRLRTNEIPGQHRTLLELLKQGEPAAIRAELELHIIQGAEDVRTRPPKSVRHRG